MIAKLARWFLFGVAFPLVPLLANYLWVGGHEQTTVQAVLRNGELYLITTTMCAVALGEVLGSAGRFQTAKIILGGGTALIMVLAIMLFVNVSEVRALKAVVDDGYTLRTSLLVFFFGVITCTSCVALSEAQ